MGGAVRRRVAITAMRCFIAFRLVPRGRARQCAVAIASRACMRSGAVLAILGCQAGEAAAANVPATPGSLGNHVWGMYTPVGDLPTGATGAFATGVFAHASNGLTLPVPVGPSFTVSGISASGSGFQHISARGASGYAPGATPVVG